MTANFRLSPENEWRLVYLWAGSVLAPLQSLVLACAARDPQSLTRFDGQRFSELTAAAKAALDAEDCEATRATVEAFRAYVQQTLGPVPAETHARNLN